MIDAATARPAALGHLRDLAALGKPRLSALVLFTAAIGVWLAPAPFGALPTIAFLIATAALVAAANTLNCWLEREIDARMHRTRERPLPAGRLAPRTALRFGIVLGAAALAVIAAATNGLTTLLGALALVSYVAVYTPLKRVTPWAMLVGAVPGALPPLMGWTAATNGLAAPGWFLFGVLFLWQLPHFTAIALYLKEDFRRGGIRVLPIARGDAAARVYLCLTTLALVAFSFAAVPLELAGAAYTLTATALGAAGVVLAAPGLARAAGERWARRMFGFSIVYLPVLITVLVLDAR